MNPGGPLRLSEKTLELNLCAQIGSAVGGNAFWFGLTQEQEARWGFDACTRLGGKLFLFQFKASNWTLRGGERRFLCDHDQLDTLRRRVSPIQRSVFYVFPLIGNTLELQRASGDLLPTTWLLDVASLTTLPPPTKSNGSLRKSGKHYVDVVPGTSIIHSDPVKARTINAAEFIKSKKSGGDGMEHLLKLDGLMELRKLFDGRAVGLVIPPRTG